LYIALWIAIHFIYSGLFSSIALSVSILTKNKKVVLILPFILSMAASSILSVFNKINYNPTYFLNMGDIQSITIIIGEFLVFSIISFMLFFIGGKKSETF